MTRDIDWAAVKAEFPAAAKSIDLGIAGGGPMSRKAAAAGARYFAEASEGGEAHWNDWVSRSEAVRRSVARTVGAAEADVALIASASVGLTLLARLFDSPSAVLTIDREFPSVTLPFLAGGRELKVLPIGSDFGVDWGRVDPELVKGCGVLAISHVGFRTGYAHDLGAIGRFCRRHGLISIVDATQSAGVLPIDMTAAQLDAVVFSAYKWPGGGYGIGALAIDARHRWPGGLPVQGWRSARVPYDLHFDRLDPTPTAEGLELGNVPFPTAFALGEALDLLNGLGQDAIALRLVDLGQRLHAGLDRLAIPVLSTREPAHMSGITIARIPDATTIVQALASKQIRVSRRGADELRISVHVTTLEADIDSFLTALADVLPR